MSENSQTEIAKKFAEATEKVKALGEEIKGRMEKGETKFANLKNDVDEALVEMNGLKAQISDLEQKLSRRETMGERQQQTLGEKFAESEDLKALQADPRGVKSAKMSIKANITSATADADGSAGVLVQPQRLPGIITPPARRLTIRDLLMPGTTDSNTIIYMRETGFTNNAKAQANEGDKKAQSDIKFDEQTVSVKTIAHYVKASRQILDDAAQLASHIDGRLTYGLQLVEEQQLLSGDGLTGNLKGIIPQATAFNDKASLAKYSIIDQLRLAQLQAVLAEYPASGHVLNPIDWAKIELSKDENGRYILGNPQDVAGPMLWRLPVVATQAIQTSKFLTGAFDLGAQIFDRQTSAVQVGFENDDFTRNLITILAEERLALAVYRPEAFIHGTLAPHGA